MVSSIIPVKREHYLSSIFGSNRGSFVLKDPEFGCHDDVKRTEFIVSELLAKMDNLTGHHRDQSEESITYTRTLFALSSELRFLMMQRDYLKYLQTGELL